MATEKLTSADGEITKCDFEMDADSKSKKSGRITMTRPQAVAVVLVFAAIVIMVGVLCFYGTKRECDRKYAALMTKQGDDEVNDTDNDDSGGGDRIEPTQNNNPDPPVVEDQEPWNGRLPTNVIPDHYDLHIKPFLNEDDVEGTDRRRFTFEGHVKIQVRCVNATDEIVLHVSNLTMLSITVVESDNDKDLYESTSYETRYSFLRIALTEPLQPGRSYNVTLDYIGEVKEEWYGLYRSSYTDQQGNQSWMAVTQFEPVHARFALPCFDEPNMKAIFNVRITHRTDMVALSNGRELATIDQGDGWSMTIFESSPVMSTYLLAVAVGVLDYRETNTTNGIRLRTWGRPDAMDTTFFALNSASALLTHFEDYFGVPYQIPKMDMIAVPDYGHGGMENWGLVTYPEGGLFFDPEVDTRSDQESMLTVISHEMAHQWFGNLVTMEWWDDLWLNEGFGTYFGYLGADLLHPELKLIDSMVSANNYIVLRNDARSSSHPIRVRVTSPSEIGEIFDDISYIKGAAVIRMLHGILGDDVFRSGIQQYLRTYKYSNANSDQLWDAFTTADRGHGNIDVWQVMDTWVLQMGYPLINLTRLNETTVSATQHRYLSRGEESDPRESPYGYVWSIYLTHTVNGSRDYVEPSTVWITDQQETEFELTIGVTSDDWYLANIHQYGFFRINYEMENWAKLVNQLNTDHEAIPVLNRAQLLEDSMSLAMNGDLPVSITFEIIGYLRNELSSAPWDAVLMYLIFFRDNLGATALQGPYEKYLREITSRAYDELGLQPTNDQILPDEEKTRELILPIACKVRNVDCSQHALTLFEDFKASYNISDPSSNILEVNSMQTLLCTAIREGTHAEWEYIWSLYVDPRSTVPQARLWITVLACTIRPWQIQRLLEYPIEISAPPGHIGYAISEVSLTPIGRTLAWDFLRHNWDELQNIFGRTFDWILLIRSVTSDFNSNEQLEEIKAFASSRDLGFGAQELDRAIAVTNYNIDVISYIYPQVKAWLEAYDETH